MLWRSQNPYFSYWQFVWAVIYSRHAYTCLISSSWYWLCLSWFIHQIQPVCMEPPSLGSSLQATFQPSFPQSWAGGPYPCRAFLHCLLYSHTGLTTTHCFLGSKNSTRQLHSVGMKIHLQISFNWYKLARGWARLFLIIIYWCKYRSNSLLLPHHYLLT